MIGLSVLTDYYAVHAGEVTDLRVVEEVRALARATTNLENRKSEGEGLLSELIRALAPAWLRAREFGISGLSDATFDRQESTLYRYMIAIRSAQSRFGGKWPVSPNELNALNQAESVIAEAALGSTLRPFGKMALDGYIIARALTAPYSGRRYSTQILDIGIREGRPFALLDGPPEIHHVGQYGAFLPDGTHIQFGSDARSHGRLAARAISITAAHALTNVRRVSWTGIQFPNPESAGLKAENVKVDTELGPTPAWRFGDERSDVWAIHVHGMGSTRAATLRGVQQTVGVGITSLVATFRNAPEGIRQGAGRPALGLAEACDIEAALAYAVKHGAERIVVLGWSMGANIALQLAHKRRWRRYIVGVIADSPVLNWHSSLAKYCERDGAPNDGAELTYPWLISGPLSRAIGLDGPLDLDALDWTAVTKIQVPTLILQGISDGSAPSKAAIGIAEANSGVSIELFEADHTMNWKSDPRRWQKTVTDWISMLLERQS